MYQLTTYTNITYIFIHQPLPNSQLPATHQLLQATFITVGKTSFTNIAIMSTAHTWSVAEDHNLVSVPSKNDNHLYAQYSSLTVKFASPFSLYVYISIRSYARFSLFNFLSLTIFLNLEEVKSVLNEVGEGTFEVLLMIDAIQRLGIDNHFHDEIEAILQRQYRIVITTDDFRDNLYEVALRFRLLRQEGYYVIACGRFLFLLIIV